MTTSPERHLQNRYRFGRMLKILAVSTVVYAVPSLATAVPVNRLGLAPMVSGLPWRLGASFCNGREPSWATWRGRPLDIIHQFTEHSTWEEMHYKIANGSNLRNAIASAPQISVTLSPWPKSLGRGRHAQCARGDFDAHFKQFGADLVRRGAGTAIVRIGHEANATTSHVWGIENLQQAQDWKICFRRLAKALKDDSGDAVKGKRRFKIEWNNARRGKLSFNVMETYPGDDVVDLWSLNVYDQGPEVTSTAVWNEYYMKTLNGGPWAGRLVGGSEAAWQAARHHRMGGLVLQRPHNAGRQSCLHSGHEQLLPRQRGRHRLRDLLDLPVETSGRPCQHLQDAESQRGLPGFVVSRGAIALAPMKDPCESCRVVLCRRTDPIRISAP